MEKKEERIGTNKNEKEGLEKREIEMEDQLEFDFEDNLEKHDMRTHNLGKNQEPQQELDQRAQKNFRQTVCRHWLRNLCMKGDKCGFLHQFDKERMPTCRYFAKYNECKEPDCPYKHSNDDVKECNMYKLGFCIHGPHCRYKHIRLEGPPPPVDEACLIGRPGHIHGVLPFAARQKAKQIQEEKERMLMLAEGNTDNYGNGLEGDQQGQQQQQQQQGSLPPPMPPGPPPKKLKTVDVNLALPNVGDEDFDFE